MSIVDGAKQAVQGLVQGAMAKAVALAPDRWIPGGTPDPLILQQHGHIGKPLSRIDGPLKVAGQARFAAEIQIDGMVYAALVHSTIAKGRIARLDTAHAEAAPGVVAVMTHENAPRLKPPPVFMSAAKAAGGDDWPVMQDATVRWNGEPVAVVLAETQEQAEHAASLVVVHYDEVEGLTSFAEAIARGTKPGAFMGGPLHNEKGDAEA
ncbi:MAG: xanthine dehydrogenase family protein molybdopterin-binding subunit, partial [Tardiphaga sp.]